MFHAGPGGIDRRHVKEEIAKEEAEISSETQKSCKAHRTFHEESEESVTAEYHVPHTT